jgi:polysaccharide export outer membrane protein
MFPLLGPVDSEGRTTAELKTKLTELLDRDYIFNPKVAVSIREYRSQKVRLLGSVGKPGIYFLEGPTRLFDLLSKAEGVSRDLGEIRRGQSVRIVRPRPGEAGGSTPVETIVVDLHDLLVAGREEANVAIRSGDVIYVAQSESIHVVGEVRRPGTFPYEAGMTVLKATSLAGGATKKGTLRGAIVRRIRNGREVEIEVKPEDLLEPEDVLDIPVSFW